jgi:TonB family protein
MASKILSSCEVRMQRRLIFFLLLAIASIAIAEDTTEATVRTLCDRSNQVSGLKFLSRQPFVMKIRVEILKTFANPALQGTVAFMDAGTFWREDLRLPDYGVETISDEKKVWTLRSTEVEPGLVTDTLKLINASPSMRPFPNFAVRKNAKEIKKQTRDNHPLTCIESALKYETCFDDATGVMVSQSFQQARWEYKDFEDFHGKLVPRKMRYLWNGQPLIDATVTGIEDVVPDPKLFVPGPGYVEEPYCQGPITPPKLLHTEDPAYPAAYKGKVHDTVVVAVKLRLGVDGIARDGIVIKTSKSEFDDEALKAVYRWRFEPWKCDGVPLARDITVQVSFHEY